MKLSTSLSLLFSFSVASIASAHEGHEVDFSMPMSMIYAKAAKAAFGSKSGKGGKSGKALVQPWYPQLCPVNITAHEPSASKSGKVRGKWMDFAWDEKIPFEELLKADSSFRKNGGAVLIHKDDDPDQDFFNRTARVTEYYVEKIANLPLEPYPTPYYEFDEDLEPDTSIDTPSGYSGCDMCTPPEPYPFRTVLPVLASEHCAQVPYAVFIPATYEDAQKTIKIIGKYKETFAIVSGGHDYGCQSGIPHGVLIITSLLNKIEIDYEKGTVTAGAGNLWANIYDQITKDELNDGPNSVHRWGVMGAQCTLVSVSGYTLGGGMSWYMTKQHGFGADSVIGMKTVTADGKLVETSLDSKDYDLQWAMAGAGGQSLGLAVEFTYEMKKSYPGNYVRVDIEYRFGEGQDYDLWELPEFVHMWAEAIEAADADETMKETLSTCNVRVGYSTRSDYYSIRIRSMATNYYDMRNYTSFAQILDIAPPRSAQIRYYQSITDYQKAHRTNTYRGGGSRGTRVSNFVKKEGLHDSIDIFLRFFLDTYQNGTDYRWVAGTSFEFFFLGDFVKNPERTSFNPEVVDAPYLFVNRRSTRETGELGDYEISEQRCMHREITKIQKEVLGDAFVGPYWNYFDVTAEKLDYYGSAFERLEKVKEKYDPDNMFYRLKGIKVDDDKEQGCLESFCESNPHYWDFWDATD